MDTKVAAVAPARDPSPVQLVAPPVQAPAPQPVNTGPDPADMRLVIEEDQATGSFVYKTINRATGEIVQQYPRAEVLKLKQELRYAAGDVIDTHA